MNSVKKSLALEALLSGKCVREAASISGITERQVYRWLEEQGFSSQLHKLERERVAGSLRSLSSLAEMAVSALEDVLTQPTQQSANIKRLAAVNVLELMLKAREQLDIEERIEALEKLVRS